MPLHDPASPSHLMNPSPGACDCQVVAPLNLRDMTALSVRASSTHLQRKLTVLLAAHDVPVVMQDGSVQVRREDFQSLEAVLGSFSRTERTDLLAAPWFGPQLDAWQMAPLEQWTQRLATTWFESASEHLKFQLQPIVALSSGQVYGYEALVRAEHDGALIGAWPLLQAAAAHGQARAFDAHARTTAIRQAYPQLGADQQLFLNFAPGVVYNPDICLQTTFATCREVGADFSRLVFEVTESEAFPDLTLLRSILDRYRQEGAQVALDDLGAGHTSLSYLAELKPDIVKLDRALVSGLHGDDRRLPLVTALIGYAHDLGVRVVAEGIETAGELTQIMALGADYAQGYFLGRPGPGAAQVLPDAAAFW
ncbi:EAL domain-containing protein (plasmid) [Deinococcus taeanensis]|uniref:EAL domain-containing protein n=1 Tax=Deinococcus taeanensis TaxID=2737050 RepID=UPI001CDBF92C|nr:EAL domain-containing protein [Deinococcus taeanensis]UBV44737.1 EAL domain-containing protein [Deinococcus taeanensis]